MLPDKAIREYRRLHEEVYGEKLSLKEAKKKAENLVVVVDFALRKDVKN